MIFSYLMMGIITGVASAIAVLYTGHNIPEAFLAYVLAGFLTTLLMALKATMFYRQGRDFY